MYSSSIKNDIRVTILYEDFVGEMEINNMALDKNMTELRRMIMMYSSSNKARRDTKVLYTDNVLNMKKINIGDARNKNADILAVYMKSAGTSLKFKVGSKYRKVFQRIKNTRKVFRNIDDEWED